MTGARRAANPGSGGRTARTGRGRGRARRASCLRRRQVGAVSMGGAGQDRTDPGGEGVELGEEEEAL